MSELQTRVQELEDALARCQKDLAKERDVTSKLQRDLKENNAQKLDQVRHQLPSLSDDPRGRDWDRCNVQSVPGYSGQF